MSYGIVTDVPAPVEVYDAIHAEVLRVAGPASPGLLVHVGRATESGFQTVEVWESKADFDRFTQEVLGPILAKLTDGRSEPPSGAGVVEFETRGLVVPQGGIQQ